MTTAYDVPPEMLIRKIGDRLKADGNIPVPKWAPFVKTGAHREKAPIQKDWWHYRVAAVLRKVYMDGPVGVTRLSADFGGKRDKGAAPYHAVRGSRSVTSEAIHQLEKAGYVLINKNRGRIVTPKGRSFIDDTAHEVLSELVKTRPELQKYLGKQK